MVRKGESMLFTRHFLKVCKGEGHKTSSSRIITEMEEHLSMAIAENATLDIESNEATAGSKNVETLAKAYSQLQKAENERLRTELQIVEAKQVNWDNILPKVAGCCVAGLVTVFWLCLEQGTPLPMRLVQVVTNLTMPRNL